MRGREKGGGRGEGGGGRGEGGGGSGEEGGGVLRGRVDGKGEQ